MDNYPVLQIVRCQLNPDVTIDHTMGYPIAMTPYLQSHFPHMSHHAHRNLYRHPCGTFIYIFFLIINTVILL